LRLCGSIFYALLSASTEAEGADVVVDTDSDNDEIECLPESVRREGMAQGSNEIEGSDSEPSTDSEIDNSDTVLDAQLDEALSLHRLPCVAHTSQLVLKEINKNTTYCNLISKTRGIVRSVRVSSVATQLLIDKSGKTVVTDCATRWNSVSKCYHRTHRTDRELHQHYQELTVNWKDTSLKQTMVLTANVTMEYSIGSVGSNHIHFLLPLHWT